MSTAKRSKHEEARVYAKSLTDDHLRGFAYDQERIDAKMVAELYQLGHVKYAMEALAAVVELGADLRRMSRFLVLELEGKRTKSNFKTKNLNIIRSYIAACAFDLSAAPTVHELQTEYARLFIEEGRPRGMTLCAWLADLEARGEIPDHKTFRKTVKRYGGKIRKDRCGRPRK
jgi:hypothetical protein